MAGILSMFRREKPAQAGDKRRQGYLTHTGAEIVRTETATYSPWSGDVFNDDITRAVIWSFAEIASKAQFVHMRGKGEGLKVNPDADIRLLLEQPNEYLTMQDVIAKMAVHYERYNNAFAYIARDKNARPILLYPLDYSSVQLKQDGGGRLFCEFNLRGARVMTAPYSDIIHIRKHFASDEFYGDDNRRALSEVMDVITTSDQGVISAVKNSAVINWILHFSQVLQPSDVKKQINEFSENYFNANNNASTIIPDDPRYKLEQLKHESYVPNAAQTERAKARIYAYYGSNEKIVTGTYTEDEYNAYFEKRVEPFLRAFCTQMTLKFFSPIDRAHFNRILPLPSSLGYSNNATRLAFVQMVDRGAMTPDEWRDTFNLPPIPGGDKPIRRLDTAAVDEGTQPKAPPVGDEPKEGEGEQMENTGNGGEEQRNATPERAARHDWLFEVRSADGENGDNAGEGYIVEGQAVAFDTPTVMYTDENGNNYYEIIASGALDGADMSDVPMRYNHSSAFMIVGRHNERRPSRSTVDFTVDQAGLWIRADLSRTESARQLYEAIKAELVTQMSFAFTVAEETYDVAARTRTIQKIKRLWDVSAVDTPAYDTTSIYARDRFAADAEAEKRRLAEAANARKAAALADLEITITLEERNERSE